jgi:trans-aconitate methyltransferase
MADWDADRYHRLSAPQFDWGLKIIERLSPRPGERILDLGCGTARLTSEIRAVAPGSVVVGLDRSAAMLSIAASQPGLELVRADGASLPFTEAFDAVFSAAALHWITDHDAAFASIFGALKPGGRLVAQCGGGPNLRRLLDTAHGLMDSPRFRGYFTGWTDPWEFADAATTRARLTRAGFVDVRTSIEPAPTHLHDAARYQEFISTVCVRHHVDRLPAHVRPAFVAELTDAAARQDPPFTLDYWRLNIAARKAAS